MQNVDLLQFEIDIGNGLEPAKCEATTKIGAAKKAFLLYSTDVCGVRLAGDKDWEWYWRGDVT